MKRSLNDDSILSSSLSKKTKGEPSKWVSGTDVRNYMINDPLVDWLKLARGKDSNFTEFQNFIIQRGNDFEKAVIQNINEKYPIIESANSEETISLMMDGIPIIRSGAFQNDKNGTKGITDLLVRSDFMHILTGTNPLPEELRTTKAPKLNGNYHYVVVDIKFSTLPLRADGIHILNSGNFPAYKAQLWIYTEGIGEIQGYISRYAYILGRRWRYTSKGEIFAGLSALDRLGQIDYKTVDKEYISRTQKAVQWVRDVRANWGKWSISPPSRSELYPNLCVDSGLWNCEKEEIAKNIGDITQLWYCGVRNREIGLKNGISSWRNAKCCSKNIGISGCRADTVDKIIKINRQEKEYIRPSKIKNKYYNWREPGNEIFVDFETFCDIFCDINNVTNQAKTDKIFMIGVYHKNEGGDWVYKNFVAKEATDEEEFRIMDEFIVFLRQQGNPRIWYWYAEKTFWTRTENRQADLTKTEEAMDHIVDDWKIEDWADMSRIFREEPIVIKDCFGFGLKEVAGALYKHGAIGLKLESNCQNGLEASIKAWNAYHGSEQEKEAELVEVAKYNQYDVQVLYEILNFLRNKK